MRSEVLAVWAPQALIDLVHREDVEIVGQSPEAFRTILNRHGLGDTWCLEVYRSHQANADTTDIALTVRADHPMRPIEKLQELVSVIAGNRQVSSAMDYSHTTVQTIPPHLLTADPNEAATELFELTIQARPRRRDPGPQR